jgi:hypothetical protein
MTSAEKRASQNMNNRRASPTTDPVELIDKNFGVAVFMIPYARPFVFVEEHFPFSPSLLDLIS